MASGFSAVTNEEVQSKINEEVVTDNRKKARKFGLADFAGKPLSVKKNLSMKAVKKFFVCKFKLILTLCYLAGMFLKNYKCCTLWLTVFNTFI